MTDFNNLIEEAFITPIRSVLIVDDQYPTWAEILNDRLPEEIQDAELQQRSVKKVWRADPAGIQKVIDQFQKRKPALIIDIHDAPKLDQTDFHLHQSDLLILDYNLEGAANGTGGDLARKILKSVLQNTQFNLVVVHTNETDLKTVFHSCLVGLTMPLHPTFKERELIEDVRERLAELTDLEEFRATEFADYFDVATYLTLRHPITDLATVLKQYMRGEGPLAGLHRWAAKLGLVDREKRGFAYWAIEEFEKSRRGDFSDTHFDGLKWAQDGERLWFRTARGFVTFVEKAHGDLLNELQLALQAWQPSPSRLLSAKVRHEISCNGVEAEDRTLSKKHVFAYFYDLIRRSDTPERRAGLIREHLNRQTETLTYQIESAAVRFGESIFEVDRNSGDTFALHYGVDLSQAEDKRSAATNFNSYVSTLPLTADEDHLDCGHIFQVNGEWWVCATPACDMKPGQNSIAFMGTSPDQRPFTALKLCKVEIDDLTPEHINSGLYCFAETEPSKVTCLGPHALAANEGGGVASSKMIWRIFVAQADGKLTGKTFELVRPKLKAGEIELNKEPARVMAKLRYEYALNYIQKIGISTTRIGLGYKAELFEKN